MSSRLILLGAFLMACTLRAAELKMRSLTVGGTTYTNVSVLGANVTDLYFTHAAGIANVKLKYVGADLQKRFHYNAKAAAEAEKQQARDDAYFQERTRANAIAVAEAKARAARRGAATSENSLADACSTNSVLGKPGPAIEVQKWLGEKPVLNGKFVLVSFWAPWSVPCRKCIPDLNSIQKKFSTKLAVIGVTSESELDVQTIPEPKPEFPQAVDLNAHLFSVAAVTSVPSVLLLDPKGVVLYQGHPAAITEAKLERLLAPQQPE